MRATKTPAFLRARRPEQKAVRRNAILAAAAALVNEEGVHGVGLNALAARAGLTKSNLYRYFESREDVLLHLFVTDLRDLCDALESGFRSLRKGDSAAVAGVIADAFLARPRLCNFLGVISSVLEQNVSENVITNMKRESLQLSVRVSAALHEQLPQLEQEDCAAAVQMIALFVAGFWPAAHPGAAAGRVLERSEFCALKPDPERDLPRAIGVILSGIAANKSAKPRPAVNKTQSQKA